MIGAAAVPSLLAASADRRYLQAKWPDGTLDAVPLNSVLALLLPHAPERVLAVAIPLVDSPDLWTRGICGRMIAGTGRLDAIPTIARLLHDPEGHVRCEVCCGIGWAVKEGRAGDEFRRRAYDLVLAQCNENWGDSTNDAATKAIALDPDRAATDLADPRWMSLENHNTYRIIEACNEAGVRLPEARLREILEQALPLAARKDCYPYKYLAAAALHGLLAQIGERARPLLESMRDHPTGKMREAALTGLLKLAGVDDPYDFIFARIKATSLDGLTGPQRLFYLIAVFLGEVCNGGLMQFFGNSSGDHAVETLAALHEFGHAPSEDALASAMKLLGPLARERDRDMRLEAVGDRFESIQKLFEPLEAAVWNETETIREKLLLYAIRHAGDFRK